MKYKGWTNDDQWNTFYQSWTAQGADKERLMVEYGVYIYQWSNNILGSVILNNSAWSPVDDNEVARLASQLADMEDVTLIGHSKGANLVERFLNTSPAASSVGKVVFLKNPTRGLHGWPVGGDAGDLQCIPQIGCMSTDVVSTRRVVNVYGTRDLAGSRPMAGAYNIESNDGQGDAYGGFGHYTGHGNAPNEVENVFSALDVGGDHGSGFYNVSPWSR